MNKVLTFSIAGYNVEKYLHTLIDSIISANLNNKIEILVINNASTDKTRDIAQHYAELYPDTVKIVDIEVNGMHGATINKGIDNATGLYFRPIDGDDWIETGNLSKLIKVMEENDPDMILCDYLKCYESTGDSQQVSFRVKSNTILNFDENYSKLFKICYHNVIYRTQILQKNRIRVQENCCYEDNEYDVYPIPYINTFIYFNLPIYCYRLGQSEQSVSKKNLIKMSEQRLMIVNNLLEFYQKYSNIVSLEKKKFIERFVANVIEGQMYIYFTMKINWKLYKKIIEFDNWIMKYPYIYDISISKTLDLWRKARRTLFIPVWFWSNIKSLCDK